MNEVRTRAGGIIGHPDERGGWPRIASGTPYPDVDGDGMDDRWELKYALSPDDGRDASRDVDGDGYTNLEEFLNYLAGDQGEDPR